MEIETIANYCDDIGGEPSAALLVFTELQELEQIEENPIPEDIPVIAEIVGESREQERKLVARGAEKQKQFKEALIQAGKDAILHISDYWSEQLPKLKEGAEEASEILDESYNNIINNTYENFNNAAASLDDIDSYLQNIKNLL